MNVNSFNAVSENCPSCSSSDWKLAHLIFLEGMSALEARSTGGGGGIGIGLGQGHGGVGLNYQNIDLTTCGTQISSIAAKYAPPAMPSEYASKDNLLAELQAIRETAGEQMRGIDSFASDSESIKPNIFRLVGPAYRLENTIDRYAKVAARLEKIYLYETELAAWKITRVCRRCDTSFNKSSDSKKIKAQRVPELDFKGKAHRCPQCRSYQWKTIEAFHGHRVASARTEVQERQATVERSEADLMEAIKSAAERPEKPNMWSRFTAFFTTTPEQAQHQLDEAEVSLRNARAQLELAVRDRASAGQSVENTSARSRLRICADCEHTYQLEV